MLLVRLAQAPSTTSVYHVHATATYSTPASTFAASRNTSANLRTNARPNIPRTHSAPNLLCSNHPNSLPQCIPKPATPRPRTRPPQPIPASRSLPSLFTTLATPSLLSVGPAGYVYTPTSMRSSRYESLRDDYGIRFRARGHRLQALLMRMRLKRSSDGREGGLGVRNGDRVGGWVEAKKVRIGAWLGRL
ncbi:hypothetical protein HBI15_209160 [Parastagonospora nodorum]|nr:hypothetical protein HBI15_209160 [Parastagonospora nodorum]